MDERVERIRAALARHGATLQEVKPLHGGACQENFRVELTIDGAPLRLALRSDAPTSLPGSLKRSAEFAVINAAVSAGVKTRSSMRPEPTVSLSPVGERVGTQPHERAN